MFTFSNFNQNNKMADYYEELPTSYIEEPISSDFEMVVNGETVPVYTCRVSKNPFNRIYPGYQRSYDQTEQASFVNLISDEVLSITIKAKKPFKKAMLKPFSRGINLQVSNNEISFTLEERGHFVLALDDWHGCLHLFNSKPVKKLKDSDATYYFGPGIHVAGKIVLKSNETLYLDKDALVFGCVFSKNAENIAILGNGLLDDTMEERFPYNPYATCYEEYTNGNIRLMDCKNVRVSGVSMRNSAVWCFGVFGCENVEIDDVKIFGQWRYNTDGIDLVNSSNVVLKNSFIHSFDDGIVLKGVVRFCAKNIKNILVENCVVWCDWGRAIEIGIETVAKSFEDITFKNCDVIRSGCAALDIQNGNEAEIHNVLYENIRVEFNAFDTPEVYQHSDVQVYDKTDELAMPKLISVSNPRLMRVCRRLGYAPENIIGGRPASVHDVVYKDVVVYYDANLPQLKDIKIETKDEFNDGRIYNIGLPDVHII